MVSSGGKRPRFAALMAFALAVGASGAAPLPAQTPSPDAGQPQHLSTVPLTIASGGHLHRFKVEVARTDAQQELGLMFRRRIDPDGGMIFPMDPPHRATFWMKNTLVPLDMVFIRTDGTIARVAANTVPLSLDLVDAGETVGSVLELAGGRAAQLHIAAGDKVRWNG